MQSKKAFSTYINWIKAGLLISLCLAASTAHSVSITIITDHQSQHQFKSLISSITKGTQALQNRPSLQVLSHTEKPPIDKALADKQTCIVSIGPKSFEKINKSKRHCSISLLISERLFLSANADFQQQASAIYTNQSLQRISGVIQRTLSHVKKVSVIVSDNWLTEALPKHSLIDLNIQRLKAGESAIEAFRLACEDSDIIIALPDTKIYNKGNIKNILLTSYKTKTPLIGYSEALARAGVLMSVFTSPKHLGKQVVEWFSQGRQKLAAEPKYFKIKLNQKVAQASGLTLKNESLFLQDTWTDSNE